MEAFAKGKIKTKTKTRQKINFECHSFQVGATIKLCFIGLGSFFMEFAIVFVGFTCFFFFVLKTELEKFLDFTRALENTLAMSIGKFNFLELREADLGRNSFAKYKCQIAVRFVVASDLTKTELVVGHNNGIMDG
jgi:hypothetical protein